MAFVVKVSRRDLESASAYLIAFVANEFEFVFGEVGDLALVLLILGIAIGDDSQNLALSRIREVFNCAMCGGSSLTAENTNVSLK